MFYKGKENNRNNWCIYIDVIYVRFISECVQSQFSFDHLLSKSFLFVSISSLFSGILSRTTLSAVLLHDGMVLTAISNTLAVASDFLIDSFAKLYINYAKVKNTHTRCLRLGFLIKSKTDFVRILYLGRRRKSKVDLNLIWT